MRDMIDVASPTRTRNASLDFPPPQPPTKKGGEFMPPPPAAGGIGEMANSPEIMTMQGLAMAKDAFQLIATGRPELAQLLSQSINDLEQLVAQATAEAMAGQQPTVTAPPGVAPTAPPPPGMAPGGPPPGQGPGPMPGMQ